MGEEAVCNPHAASISLCPPPIVWEGVSYSLPPIIGGIIDEGGGISPTRCPLLTSFTPLIGGVVLIYLKILNVLKIN